MLYSLIPLILTFTGSTYGDIQFDLSGSLIPVGGGVFVEFEMDFKMNINGDIFYCDDPYYDDQLIKNSLDSIKLNNISLSSEGDFIYVLRGEVWLNNVPYDSFDLYFSVDSYYSEYLDVNTGDLLGSFLLFDKDYSETIYNNGFQNGVNQTESLYNTDWIGWIGDTLSSVLDIELFMGFTLGGIFGTCIIIMIMIWILKVFAGG